MTPYFLCCRWNWFLGISDLNWNIIIQFAAEQLCRTLVRKRRGTMQSNQMDLWERPCIFRVPACMKDENPKAYTPQLVSIGPYHHGQTHLTAMEEHKDRAFQRFLQRTSKSYEVYCETLRPLTPDLMNSYPQLSNEWRKNPDRFLELMIRDGCFLYEFLRGLSQGWEYSPQDPVFSFRGFLKLCTYIVPDILMLENQLPLKVIERLIAVETNQLNDENVEKTHELVFKFLGCPEPFPNNMPLGLHVLDVSRKVISNEVLQESNEKCDVAVVVKSASELYDAGVRFRKSETQGGSGISYADGILKLPLTKFDSGTEPLLLNAIAFESLHPTAGLVVSSYIAFMQGLIKSTSDASILVAKELIESTIGGDEVVANLMKRISKNVFFDPHSNFCKVRDLLNQYHAKKMKSRMKQLRKWWRQLHQIYFRSPWSIISIFAATVLLVLTLIQTIYSVRSYNVSVRGNH